MNILFIHRDFPAQFKYLALVLANNPGNNVVFVTEENTIQLNGINKIVYTIDQECSKNCNPCLAYYESHIIVAQAVAKAVLKLKEQGYKPDIIYGFSGWGSTLFMKDIYPDVPLISYCEWFSYAGNELSKFEGQTFTYDELEKIRCANSGLLVDLASCDAAITPTQWQKQQFPKEFHNKISVIHDGIDTETCSPNSNTKFLIKEQNLELTSNDEVITYGTRGMEFYRGFPQFMEAVEIILKKRPKAHVVIAGADITCYGPRLEKGSYKQSMLEKLDIDMNRVHFVGTVSFYEFIDLLRISSVHVYATVPYILSWSLLNAMSTGCCIVASNTKPIQEVITDNYNGLLYDFFDINQLVDKIEYALDNQDKVQEFRVNARQRVIDRYDIKNIIIEQIKFLRSFIRNIED